MPIKVEAAVVTQKHPSAAFNTDSININGKVLPRETVKNGYKGSGIIGGNSYFVLTSSDVEGFADAAVTAFNNRAEIFGVSRDARSVFSGFFEDCRSALFNMSREEKELSSVCLYARGRKAVLAANYKNGLFLFRNGECLSVEAKPAEDTVANYSNAVLPDLTEGDIFLLLSPDAAKLLTQKDVADICKISDGSVKKIVSLISKVVLAKDGCKAVGAFAIKILETAVENEDSLGFASVFASPDSENKAETATKNVVNEEAENDEINENTAENGEAVISSESSAVVATEENGSSDTEVVETVEAAQNEAAENANADLPEKTQGEPEKAEEAEGRSEEVNEDDESEAEVEVESVSEEVNTDENGEKPSGEKRTKLFIALFSLVALSVFLFVVIFFVRGFSGDGDTDVNATEDETTTEMSETESESESTSQDEEETASESTTSEEISSEATTEKREESTTKKTNNSVSYNEKTTKAETQTEPKTTAAAEEISSEEASATEAETEESTSEKAEETTGEETENSTQEETPSESEINSEESNEEPSVENNVENSSAENA